jgi:hypothetical protein
MSDQEKQIFYNFRKIIGDYSFVLPCHDPSTAWYEWNMYVECCNSLSIPGQPSVNRYLKYRQYLKEVGVL